MSSGLQGCASLWRGFVERTSSALCALRIVVMANQHRGDQYSWPVPSHTTRHAGPHRAVETVEVGMPIPEHDAWIHLAPTRPIWFFAVTGTSGFTCCTFHDEPRIRASEAYPSRMVRQTYPSAPLALRRRFRPSRPSPRLLWPLLTSHSGLHRRPFRTRHPKGCRHEARSPQVRTHSFPAQPPDGWRQLS